MADQKREKPILEYMVDKINYILRGTPAGAASTPCAMRRRGYCRSRQVICL
jgi:hypothetical protein